ncbi:MAG: DUF6268 family outer membrane beta-barrel protein [Flavobacteriaceae bacterium]
MKQILICLFFVTTLGFSQNYVDLVKLSHSYGFENRFEGTEFSTDVLSLEADLTLPIPINEKYVFVTGVSFTKNRLQLFPDAPFQNLYGTTLKLGVLTQYNEKWSSTLVLLPKVSSDFEQLSTKDFYLGGFAMFKYQKRENLIYRFGAYGSREAFGFFTTPIVGFYYLSPNSRFQMDVSMPISADINYAFNKVTLGVDYYGIGRSFNITEEFAPKVYVDLGSLEFSGYLQLNTFQKTVLLRLKAGYSSNDFEVYQQGDNINLGLSAFTFGDDRKQLNPQINDGMFVRLEAIYRLRLPAGKEKND